MKPHPPATEVFVALGSNLGDRAGQLEAAVLALVQTPGLAVSAASSVYETEPVGGPPQPFYLNAVLRLHSQLEPRPLLDRLLEIERRQGRCRGPLRDAPRSLDLDLLLYGNRVIDEPGLCIPHPRLHQRAFVLEPLAELAPDLRHPTLGSGVFHLAEAVRGHAGSGRRIGPLSVPEPSLRGSGPRPDSISAGCAGSGVSAQHRSVPRGETDRQQ